MPLKTSDFETVLKEEGTLTFTNVGYSMYPLIEQGKDILTIKRKEREVHRYDVVLFKDGEHHYVLHRILKVKKDTLITAGDNNPFKDRPIKESQVLGILTSITKGDGRVIDMEKERKPFFQVHFFYCKAFFLLFKRGMRKIFRKRK